VKRKRFSLEQINVAIQQHELGTSIPDICRKLGISEATFYRWKKNYGGLELDQVRELKKLQPPGRLLLALSSSSAYPLPESGLIVGIYTDLVTVSWDPVIGHIE
jgi:putative transposase